VVAGNFFEHPKSTKTDDVDMLQLICELRSSDLREVRDLCGLVTGVERVG
jgi:hypothetical protein